MAVTSVWFAPEHLLNQCLLMALTDNPTAPAFVRIRAQCGEWPKLGNHVAGAYRSARAMIAHSAGKGPSP